MMMDRKIPDAILEIPSNYTPSDDFLNLKSIRAKKTEFQASNSYQNTLLKTLNQVIAKAGHQSSGISNFSSSASGGKRINVVIKNIGNMKREHLQNALSYALEKQEDGLAFNEDFQQVSLKEILEDWSFDFNLEKDLNEAMHLVFSLKEAPTQDIAHSLLISSFETLKTNLPDYKFAIIPHTHQNYPHMHIILNKTNQLTGNKLHFASALECKNFFHHLREDFKNNLSKHSARFRNEYVNEVNLNYLIDRLENSEPRQTTRELLGLLHTFSQNFNAQYQRRAEDPKSQKSKDQMIETLKDLVEFKDHFMQYCHNLEGLRQKKIVLEKLESLDKRGFNKECILALQKLKSEVEMEQKKMAVPLLQKYGIQVNQKTNTMTLKKAFYRLRKIDFLLPQTSGSEEQKSQIKATIKLKQDEILELLQQRLNLIIQSFRDNKEKKKQLYKELGETEDPEAILKLLKKIERVEKNLKFNALEILSAQKLLAKESKVPKEVLKEALQNTQSKIQVRNPSEEIQNSKDQRKTSQKRR